MEELGTYLDLENICDIQFSKFSFFIWLILMISFILNIYCFRTISFIMSQAGKAMARADEWFHSQRSTDQASPYQWLNHSNNENLQTRTGEDNIITTLIGRDHDSFEDVVTAASDIYTGPVPVCLPNTTDQEI